MAERAKPRWILVLESHCCSDLGCSKLKSTGGIYCNERI